MVKENVKGIVSVISRDLSCKDGNVRFTTFIIKNFSSQENDGIHIFYLMKILGFMKGTLKLCRRSF